MRLLHRLAPTAVALPAVCVLTLACRQLVGIGDEPPSPTPSAAKEAGADASGPRCGVTYEGKTCEACLESDCCMQANACAGSAACNQLETCLGSCSGQASCRAACLQDHRAGPGGELPAFDSCMVAHCSGPCGLACGGAAEIATPDAAAACQDCFVNKACAATSSCLGDPSCADYAWCLLAAPTPDTFGSCTEFLDGGLDGSSSVIGLAAAYCGPECALTSNWSCVGRVEWPPGATQDLTIVLQLIDGATLQPSGGVTAKICAGGDEACAGPLATGVTDANTGTVELTQHPEAGSVVPNGYIDLSGNGIVPEVFFWSFPLSEHRVTLSAVT
ncbi:MAG TPA: hypothetical protein VF765_20845, partial [Polyangiaceae bacterium]